MNLHRRALQGALIVLTGAIFFSTKAIFVKLAYQHGATAVPLLALRLLFAFPVYAAIAWRIRPKGESPRMTPRDYLTVGATGITGYYFASLFDFLGLQYVSAGIERLILFSYPTLVVLISWAVFRKPITRIQAAALAITYAGILLVMTGDIETGDRQALITGSLWIFACALTYAIYLVANGRLVHRFGTLRFTAWSMLAACLCMFAHAALQLDGSLWRYPWQVYLYAGLMAMLSTVIPTFMLSEGIRRVGAGPASILGAIGPVSTLVMAYVVLGESFTWMQAGGTAIVMAGILLITRDKPAPQRGQEPMPPDRL
ncbi:MAG: DMT family transporter [Bacteroidia bacterium]|nr:DMT family transporter [Bacteroidia bacterium]